MSEIFRIGNAALVYNAQCPVCGLDFMTSNPNKIYCSDRCRRIAKYERKKKSTETPKICTVFNCDYKHGNLCCHSCDRRRTCHNRCQNSPDKCKLIKENENEK